MEKNLGNILRGGAFYAVLAVCLAAVGVGGYFLLWDREDAAEVSAVEPQMTASEPMQSQTNLLKEDEAENAAVPEKTDLPQETPKQEVSAYAMPEVEIDDTPIVVQAPRLTVSPLQGEIVAAFSMDALSYNETLDDWRTHDGIDIAAKPGTTVLAASSGVVACVEEDALMGTTVMIDHEGGYRTTYANLQKKPAVVQGDAVSAGQIIGAVGTTAAAESAQAPHLHFSVTRDGVPVDPHAFLND